MARTELLWGMRPRGGYTMPVVDRKDVPIEPFSGGATYQTLVGDPEGSTSSHPHPGPLPVGEGEEARVTTRCTYNTSPVSPSKGSDNR
jgi:hypothetical protein